MKVKLSEQSKAEFIEHISKQSIECWFDGDEFIMPSGQGKASKGIVLYQLQVWQLKQAEIDEKDKRIEELERALKLKTRCSDFYENSRKAHIALSRYRKQKIDELREHSISLRDAAKSWTYTEREKNILISQADDIDRILGGEKALRGEHE